MNVLTKENVPITKHAEYMQQLLSQCVAQNNLIVSVNNVPWELVAIIDTGSHDTQLLVSFALRSTADSTLKISISATAAEREVPLETLTQSTDGFIEPELFLDIATRTMQAISELNLQFDPNTVH
jgi:hypothetical protein